MAVDVANWGAYFGSRTELAVMRRRREQGIESLSFLDIITCGFGAILLLLIITKPVPDSTDFATQDRDLSSAIAQLRQAIATLQANATGIRSRLADVATPDALTISINSQLRRTIEDAKQALEQLKMSNRALEVVRDTQKKTTIQVTTAPEERDEEVGGIPVDSKYVIFVVDTSGSMAEIWPNVTVTMERILDIHPKVLGFQIMNDNGNLLFQTTRNKWLKDTPGSRNRIKQALQRWNSFSNSSPAEGLEMAMRKYANRYPDISIYIVGDDYTGDSYETVIGTLETLNRDPKSGRPKVRVHSLGFFSPHGSDRFATLMRYIAERNRGAFIGLPN